MIQWPIKFVESKYSRWYYQLIKKAQLRDQLSGYVETHHIIPRSFGGSNTQSNLVELTAREHYIAHALLWKMKFEGVYGSKMAFAFNTFINKMTTKERGIHHTYTISSRVYETFRKHYAEVLREKMTGQGNHFYGKKHSEESRRIIGEKSKLKKFKRGAEHFNYGKPSFVTPEGKARQRAAIKERWADPEYKQTMLEKRRAYFQTPEGIAQRQAMTQRQLGVKRDPAAIEKTAAAKRGKTWEELYTPEQIERMRASLKNKVYSEEGKQRRREASRQVGLRPKSEEHRRKLSESNKKHDRWWTRGENNPNYGKKWSNEMKQAMSERMKGVKYTPERLEAARAARLANSKSCEHCGKLVTSHNYTRWHSDNCKVLKKAV